MSATIAINSINIHYSHGDHNTNLINSVRSEPPAYSEDDNDKEINTTSTSDDVSIPTSALLSPNSSSHQELPTNQSSESLPSYDHVKIDVPPSYPAENTTNLKLGSFYDLVPIEPQNPWPITKKFYIFGYLLWPLWYIGILFSFFGKDQETKRWGRRCIFNSVIVSLVLVYLIVASKSFAK
ncbi:1822_t:CDS:1 [Funneliformis geosporum]|uniref:12612_t:CDS:1 n=1 Tax=Funneliformis geosporum TaxID=1117311 RepID=A0A9W4WPY6_9GLOM|nr:12612_t:CDS:1 [Funneliformis geosporum]CAI2167375.1 1822_t:CDS:1 [Funneliformis geosporum]